MMTAQQQVHRMGPSGRRRHDDPHHGLSRAATRPVLTKGIGSLARARVQASQAAGMNAVVAARENRLLAMVTTFSRKSAPSIRRHAVRSSAYSLTPGVGSGAPGDVLMQARAAAPGPRAADRRAGAHRLGAR